MNAAEVALGAPAGRSQERFVQARDKVLALAHASGRFWHEALAPAGRAADGAQKNIIAGEARTEPIASCKAGIEDLCIF
jgi:hypothetical protein